MSVSLPRPACRLASQGHQTASRLLTRCFSATRSRQEDATVQAHPSSKADTLDPYMVGNAQFERKLKRVRGLMPIGSRRRRAALWTAQSSIPFEQLPYQCFQEARKILAADREEKLRKIDLERRRIALAQSKSAEELGGVAAKRTKLLGLHMHLEHLKVLADINDPMVRMRFEDGHGDMNKPIYRYLAERKWRSYDRKINMQRLEQMYIVPDLLPWIDIKIETKLYFPRPDRFHGRLTMFSPGTIIPTAITARAPTLEVQSFRAGRRLFTVIVIDPDVPDFETDKFRTRCHFMAVNIPLSPTETRINFANLDPETQVVLPWIPPFANFGSKYHRLSIFISAQPYEERLPLVRPAYAAAAPEEPEAAPASATVSASDSSSTPPPPTEMVLDRSRTFDVAALRARYLDRLDFNLRAFCSYYGVSNIGATLFRTVWDQDTPRIMQEAGLPGADIAMKRKPSERLPEYLRIKDTARYR